MYDFIYSVHPSYVLRQGVLSLRMLPFISFTEKFPTLSLVEQGMLQRALELETSYNPPGQFKIPLEYFTWFDDHAPGDN
jgi:hypothetical protein